MPQQVVKGGFDAPCAERMKQDPGRICRLVCVKLVKQLVTRMRRIYQLR
jgi:hypothetical protein